jgi:hypothetical protein
VVVDQANGKFLVCDGTNVFDQVTPGIGIPLAVSDGGTGATSASGARVNLGGTTVGNAVFTAANAGAALTAIGAVEQGGGPGQFGNKINIGWDNIGKLLLAVDGAAAGAFLLDSAGSVGTTQLADSSVTTAKMANAAVTNAKLANMSDGSIKGRTRFSGTGEPEDLGFSQVLEIVNAALATSIGVNGYVTLTTGLIVQWGFNVAPQTSKSNGDTTHAITFPVTFPNQAYTVLATALSGNVQGAGAVVRDVTTGGYVVNLRGNASTAYAVNYIAIGV